MDFSALGGCRQPIHVVPRRSSVSSKHSSKVRFSGFFIVPAGARMFCLGMLALVLTLPWNPPSAYARNFSNDAIPAPPIVMGVDAPSASPAALPSDASFSARPEVPPSLSLAPTSPPLPSGSPRPISMANPPSPSTGAPRPTPSAKKRKRLSVGAIVGIVVSAFVLGICILCCLLCRRRVFRRPLRIFISHAHDSDDFSNELEMFLNVRFTPCYLSTTDPTTTEVHETSSRIFRDILAPVDVQIAVITKEYFESMWQMVKLIAFMEAQRNDDPRRKIRTIPLFYELTPDELKVHLHRGTWEHNWKEMKPIEVEKCREAVTWLCNGRGIQFDSQRRHFDKGTVFKDLDKILCKERSFASNPRWTKTTVMIYINEMLRLLFALSGLLIILLSVILDNSFNDQPVRFTAFAILAPLTIFLGFLASGWFPRIPLRFIAFVKRRGFLQHVVPCSPWHDNVVTDFRGEVCALEPLCELLEQGKGARLFEFPMSVQNFLHGNRISPEGTTATTPIHGSTFDSEIQDFQVATSVQEVQDLQGLTTGGENIVVEIVPSRVFQILGDERAAILEFNGPEINGFPLTVQAFKNTLTDDHTFDLSCTFRNKKTKRMYLTTERLENLVHNMCQWVENPYPIVVDKSSDILHCMAIEDILWEFTKTIYTFRPAHVEYCFLAGLGQIKFFVILSYVSVTLVLSLIPLISDKKSLFFLFFLFVLAPYLFASRDTNPLTFYFIKSLVCPICVKIFGFNKLYKSRSSFRWCNEFRKKRIVNPTHFWIDEEYANTCPDADSCLDVCGFLQLPDSPPKGQSFTVSCQGWPAGVPAICMKQHDYKLRVKFDSVKLIEGVDCYTNVRLSFLDDDYLLGDKTYTAIEVQRVHLVEKLFHCFSNPSFGGYVEKIGRTGYCSTTFVAHCPRFIDFCQTVLNCKNPVPKLLVASRMPGSKFVVGVPFWSLEL